MIEKHEKSKLVDPLTAMYGEFPVSEAFKNEHKLQKLKIKEWESKDVMLPILGKNKRQLLHSIE